MRFATFTLALILASCSVPTERIRDIDGGNSGCIGRLAFHPDCWTPDAQQPDVQARKAKADKALPEAFAALARQHVLEAFILGTERLDAPTVTIRPAPRKYDEAPQIRVTVKFPGPYPSAIVDHYSLGRAFDLAIQCAIQKPKDRDFLCRNGKL